MCKTCKTCKWWGKSAIESGYSLLIEVPEGYRECMLYTLRMKIFKEKDPNPFPSFVGIDIYRHFSPGDFYCLEWNGDGDENKIGQRIDDYLKWRDDPKRIKLFNLLNSSKMSQMPCYTRSIEAIRKILAETDEDRKNREEQRQELIFQTKKEMLIRKLELET